jgi:hypothetical protein
MSRLDARASTSSLPLVRTTLNGHSSANIDSPPTGQITVILALALVLALAPVSETGWPVAGII